MWIILRKDIRTWYECAMSGLDSSDVNDNKYIREISEDFVTVKSFVRQFRNGRLSQTYVALLKFLSCAEHHRRR